jgi:hypothetical protein
MAKTMDAAQYLALEIADDDSINVIEYNGTPIKSKSGALLWYEIDPTDLYSWFWVSRAVRYLEMRGKLRRRKSNPHHVKAVR